MERMKIKVISESPKETQKIASFFMQAILRQYTPKQNGMVVSLEGPLGGGKTEFLKGIAKFLKLKEKIFSPTFLIMKSFPCKTSLFKTLWHLDCYRIEKSKEIKELDFSEIIKNPQNLIFIEWGNKIKKILPKNHLKIKFKIIGEHTRILEFYLQ
jgi:tRNA threonylcarbamoyladenosine biosynthesis protein TsaE